MVMEKDQKEYQRNRKERKQQRLISVLNLAATVHGFRFVFISWTKSKCFPVSNGNAPMA
jgi:hypothetical protein